MTNTQKPQAGSALVIAIIVLAILGVFGFVALEVAELNIFMAANDRDSKEAFFYADSGANIGRELVKKAFDEANSTFFDSKASDWIDTPFNADDFPLKYYNEGMTATHIRGGILRIDTTGSATIIGGGYEGFGKGLAHGAGFEYLIRSHREGRRNSRAEVDLGFRDVDN